MLWHLHLDELASINVLSCPLSSDLRWENQILQHPLVNLLERSGPGPGLLDTRVSSWLPDHSSLGNEDNVTVRELLLQFSGDP